MPRVARVLGCLLSCKQLREAAWLTVWYGQRGALQTAGRARRVRMGIGACSP